MVALRDTAASTSTSTFKLGMGDCGCEDCRGSTNSLDWGERLTRVMVPGPVYDPAGSRFGSAQRKGPDEEEDLRGSQLGPHCM